MSSKNEFNPIAQLNSSEHSGLVEYGEDGLMKWQRVDPPIPWPKAQALVVADRHLPCGTRQHMVRGSVPPGQVVANAQVVGEDDVPNAEFSSAPSHLSR